MQQSSKSLSYLATHGLDVTSNTQEAASKLLPLPILAGPPPPAAADALAAWLQLLQPPVAVPLHASKLMFSTSSLMDWNSTLDR
jgi:hypothetical protein